MIICNTVWQVCSRKCDIEVHLLNINSQPKAPSRAWNFYYTIDGVWWLNEVLLRNYNLCVLPTVASFIKMSVCLQWHHESTYKFLKRVLQMLSCSLFLRCFIVYNILFRKQFLLRVNIKWDRETLSLTFKQL